METAYPSEALGLTHLHTHNELPLLITPLSFGRGIVCPYHTTTSDYAFYFWPWYCLSLSNYHF
jgi:hypothetical protein